ncbi:MAG: type II toxin-antitoxin system RelE/ParE family toxin [Holophagaceae bacterium]|nr:type II toxin-antitoxin system RelE/ParE family toxin [Holophagaceae bacterium]
MKHYDVLISSKAFEDMEAIFDYIAGTLLEPRTAENQYDRIADAILSLEKMPERIRLLDSEPERSKGLRPLLVDNYTVFFIIKAKTVHIARVLYSASDLRKRLSEG